MAILVDFENDILFRKGFEEGFERGYKQGFEKGIQLIILLSLNEHSFEEIAQMCDLSLEKVKSCAERLEDL